MIKPWHGVLVANTLPFNADFDVDFERLAAHVEWLADAGCDGLIPNGSLGEYQTLSDEERSRVLEVAVAAAPPGFSVIPGVASAGWRESVRWTEQAAKLGAPAVMSLPPNIYRADDNDVLDHFRAIAAVGLPVMAYNNPYDTKVDLVPELLARLHDEGVIVAVKDFSGDPRRAYAIKELAPDLDLLIGSDDTVLEMALAGACGWVSGYTNVFPASCIELYRASIEHDLEHALPLYRSLHALLRWDARTEFVQAIKLSMDVAGGYGGPCRPPRERFTTEAISIVTALTTQALEAGMH